MRLTATFIGTTSMGFETGKVYEISLSQAILEKSSKLCLCVEELTTNDVMSWCHYGNFQLFLSNWKVNKFHLSERPLKFWNKEDYSNIKETIISDIRDNKLSKILN